MCKSYLSSFISHKLNVTRPIKVYFLRPLTLFILFIPLLCRAFQGIDFPDTRPFQDPPLIKVKGDTLFYDGKITKFSAVKVIKIMRNHSVNKISINSIGGDAENALAIGYFIYHHGVDIEVRTVCASACANYLFPAARNKYLSTKSMLLWHGGLNGPQKEFKFHGDITKDQFFKLKKVKELIERDKNFHNEVNVDLKISFCPQLQKHYNEKFPEKWFSYTPQDMEKFGVKNIHFAKSASQWLTSMRKQHVLFATYCK